MNSNITVEKSFVNSAQGVHLLFVSSPIRFYTWAYLIYKYKVTKTINSLCRSIDVTVKCKTRV